MANEEVTREEIEAAARAMCLARKPKHPSLNDDDRYWSTHGSRDIYLDMACVALLAASQSRPTKGAAPSVSEIDELYSRAFDLNRVVLDRDSCRDDFCNRLRDVWPDLRASLISALNWMELFQDQPMTASEHSELGEAIERLRGMRTKGAALSLQNRPVAFRAKDALDQYQWILFDNEDEAASYAADTGSEYQGLYARDDKSPAPGRGMVAEGWVLVPKEPTKEMNLAAEVDCSLWWTKGRTTPIYGHEPSFVYRAMLASAPIPSPDNGWLTIESLEPIAEQGYFLGDEKSQSVWIDKWKNKNWEHSKQNHWSMASYYPEPTHYRPLPPPPAQGGGK